MSCEKGAKFPILYAIMLNIRAEISKSDKIEFCRTCNNLCSIKLWCSLAMWLLLREHSGLKIFMLLKHERNELEVWFLNWS